MKSRLLGNKLFVLPLLLQPITGQCAELDQNVKGLLKCALLWKKLMKPLFGSN